MRKLIRILADYAEVVGHTTALVVISSLFIVSFISFCFIVVALMVLKAGL